MSEIHVFKEINTILIFILIMERIRKWYYSAAANY